MKQTVNEFMFMEEFKDMGRMDNFTPEALRSLYSFLESMEEDTGEESELDVIGLCCDFSQEPVKDVLENYSLESLDDLQDETIVVDTFEDGTVLYLNF